MKVRDAHAERLEVFDLRTGDAERDWLRRVPGRKTARGTQSWRDVNQAANTTLRRMGLPAGGQHGETLHENKENGVDKT